MWPNDLGLLCRLCWNHQRLENLQPTSGRMLSQSAMGNLRGQSFWGHCRCLSNRRSVCSIFWSQRHLSSTVQCNVWNSQLKHCTRCSHDWPGLGRTAWTAHLPAPLQPDRQLQSFFSWRVSVATAFICVSLVCKTHGGEGGAGEGAVTRLTCIGQTNQMTTFTRIRQTNPTIYLSVAN
eukprot:m.193591 g.193591  ORF g.193591 m.193591 type:complete len:178 (+) comp39480_c0_seq1:648-1181(+)